MPLQLTLLRRKEKVLSRRVSGSYVRDAVAHDYPLTMNDLADHQPEWGNSSARPRLIGAVEIPPNSWGLSGTYCAVNFDRLNILDYRLTEGQYPSAGRSHSASVRYQQASSLILLDALNAGGPTHRPIRTLSDQVSLEQAGQPLAPLPASDTVYPVLPMSMG